MSGADHFDEGKPRLDLIPHEAILGMGLVFDAGARKYSDRNWEKGMPLGKLYASAMRHLVAWQSGNDIDAESGLPHLAHALTNIAMLYALSLRRPDLDNRWYNVAHESNQRTTQSDTAQSARALEAPGC